MSYYEKNRTLQFITKPTYPTELPLLYLPMRNQIVQRYTRTLCNKILLGTVAEPKNQFKITPSNGDAA